MHFQREGVFETNVVGTFTQRNHIRKKSKLSTKKKAEHCKSPASEVGLAQPLMFLTRNES